jgi:uncharacterized protein (TIGR00661 family)
VRTALEFLRCLPDYAQNFDVFQRISQEFRPELCIADFESFAYLYAKQHDLPVLSIDNMQVINRCAIRKDIDLPGELAMSFQLTKAIVKAKLPRCDHYLITSFFAPPISKKRTSLYPPILREEILRARATASRGDHVLVYQTADSYHDLPAVLQAVSEERFVVYGWKREEQVGNLTLKNFSERGFVDDLKSAKAVIAGGGYSLMGESIYLGKPMLCVPLMNQFEQALNGLYLAKLHYGEYCAELSPERIRGFLTSVPRYTAAVARHEQDGNRLILEALARLIKDIKKHGRLL